MSFIYPWFLLGLAAIAIPIIIHLFHFRRFKKVYFSSTKFLEKVTDETEKQSKLKHLLILLSRILVITFLVMAFARPFIPLDESMISFDGNAVSIYIDNSFSMEDESVSGSMLDLAKEKAREVVNAYSYTDEFMLLTNDFKGKHQRFVSKDEFLALLNDVRISPAVRTISEVSARQQEILHTATMQSRTAYIISDFQENISDFKEIEQQYDYNTLLLPLQGRQTDNLYIDSVWIDSPVRLFNQTVEIKARISNVSNNSLENQPVRLHINGAQRGVATYNVAAEAYTEVSFTFTVNKPDYISGYLEITDYPITFDNRFYFSFNVTSNINVLSINQNQPNRFLNALFSGDTLFNYDEMHYRAIDYSAFQRQGLIILNDLSYVSQGLNVELSRYVKNGGNLLIFPGENLDIDSYSNFLNNLNTNVYTSLDTVNTRVSSINDQHEIYRDVFDKIPENIDLPFVRNYYRITRDIGVRSEDILTIQNGLSFLSSYTVDDGKVFLSAVGLSDYFSNLQRHSIFVPTVYNIALQSNGLQRIFHVIGDNKPVILRQQPVSKDDVLTIEANGFEFIPQHRNVNNLLHLHLFDQVDKDGIYNLKSGEKVINTLAFNFDRRGSETYFLTVSEVKEKIMDNNLDNIFVIDKMDIPVDKFVKQLQSGKQYWMHFLLLALAFLFFEIILLRFLK